MVCNSELEKQFKINIKLLFVIIDFQNFNAFMNLGHGVSLCALHTPCVLYNLHMFTAALLRPKTILFAQSLLGRRYYNKTFFQWSSRKTLQRWVIRDTSSEW